MTAAASGPATKQRAHARPSQEWSNKECQVKGLELKMQAEPEKNGGR